MHGLRGEKGPVGETGDTGRVGLKGHTGPKGDQGLTGDTGMTGQAGARGKSGVTGEQGLQAVRKLVRTLGVFVAVCVLALLDQSYVTRRDLALHDRAACKRQVADRVDTIQVRQVQAASDQAIAADPFQSKVTRATRAHQAAVEWASGASQRARTDPAHGGRLDCAREFPDPPILKLL